MSMERDAIIDTDALIDHRRIGKLQYLVAFLGACALMVEGFDTQVIGYIAPQLTRLWHVPASTLGLILSADMLGLLFGYLVLSPLSARFGHKRMVVACTTAFGLLTFLTITATAVPMLIGFRFLTGIGVGGAMPSAVALTGEYFPERVRSTSITLIYIGYSVGQVAAGIAARGLLPGYGWQSVLGFGGVMTLILSGLFALLLPESIEFLINRGNDVKRALNCLRRLAPDLAIPESVRLTAGAQGGRKITVRQLFEGSRGLGTIFIWVGMFVNLMIFFFLQKWLAQLLVLVGLTQAAAITATTVGLTGGILAAFIIGPLMDRFGPYPVVSGLFLVSAASCAGMAAEISSPSPFLVVAMSLAVGFCLSGGQKANNALSVFFYPTALRGTGLGWSLGVGRVGGVLGPFLAGQLLGLGWSPGDLFFAATGPLILGAAVISAMGRIYGERMAAKEIAGDAKMRAS
jgi:MFS transporter, AAHS family, 4-hydroxybenzoate transporter